MEKCIIQLRKWKKIKQKKVTQPHSLDKWSWLINLTYVAPILLIRSKDPSQISITTSPQSLQTTHHKWSTMQYIYPQETASSQETVHTKHVFEDFDRFNNIPHIYVYQCNNRRFSEILLLLIARNSSKKSYYGVGTYYQNCIVKKCIIYLTKKVRKMILHDIEKQPKTAHTFLRRYAFQSASRVFNTVLENIQENLSIE